MSTLTHEMRNNMAPLLAAVSLLKNKVKVGMSIDEVADLQKLFSLHERAIEGMRITLLAMEAQQRASA